MAEIRHSYPFDPTGRKGSNFIRGEKHALSPPAWKDYHFIIPKLAPFFRESLKIRDLQTGRELVEGQDWMASHRFLDASRSTAIPIYGSITFYDKTLAGVVEIEYQTLGGDWTIDGDLITQIMIQTSTNPRVTTWENVVDLPFQFPVINHNWHTDDLIGMSHVKDAVDKVSDTILETRDIRPMLRRHLKDEDNPHNVTKEQVELGEVENFPPATRAQALEGTDDASYTTPRRVRQAIERFGYEYTDEHAIRGDNPHRVGKVQVGLGLVQNLPLSEERQAEDGDSHDSYMTPLRVSQAIQAQVRRAFDNHLRNDQNPHDVDKRHVGLWLVENHPPATKSEAESGSRDDRNMSPKRTYQAIARFGYQYTDQEIDKVLDRIRALEDQLADSVAKNILHEHQDKTNPHETNAADLGLARVENTTYLTLSDLQGGLTASDLAAHLSAPDPHWVGKRHVGLNEVRNLSYMTVGQVLGNLTFDDFNYHLSKGNPHGTTALKLGLDEVVNTSMLTLEDALMGMTGDDYGGHVSHPNPHHTNAWKLNLGRLNNTVLLTLGGAMDRLNSDFLTLHLSTTNPHHTDTRHIGLASLSNHPVLTLGDTAHIVNLPSPKK